MKYKDEEVSFENLLLSQTYTIQAVINILERKGLITKQEIIDELKQLEDDAIGQYKIRSNEELLWKVNN